MELGQGYLRVFNAKSPEKGLCVALSTLYVRKPCTRGKDVLNVYKNCEFGKTHAKYTLIKMT